MFVSLDAQLKSGGRARYCGVFVAERAAARIVTFRRASRLYAFAMSRSAEIIAVVVVQYFIAVS